MTDLFVWIRTGDAGEYEAFDSPEDAGAAIADLLPAPFDAARTMRGFAVPGCFEGENYVSAFWGDRDAEYSADLSDSELQALVRAAGGELALA